MQVAIPALALALALVAGACGDDGNGNDDDSRGGETAPAAAETYTPVSDVESHSAIGDDVGRIKETLAAAKQGTPVDWAAVRAVWEQGGASRKGDGSLRTLRTLVDDADTVRFVEDAIDGTGASAGASDAVRAQRVDKGISVLLARKVVDELDAAADKVEAGRTAAADGAPHNVDEAWAFFTANGNGLAATADKRAADFDREGAVREPIVAALEDAQAAAGKGDRDALAAATERVARGLDYVFYLATYKYLAADDEVGRAEGAAFYRGIQPRVRAADAQADAAVVAAFGSGDAAAGRTALHRSAVLQALGVDDEERVDRP